MCGDRLYIRQWRRFRNMKQESLAAETGLSQSTISDIESGRQGYTRASLQAISRALDTRPGYLLEFDPLEDPAFWRAWLRLPSGDRSNVEVRIRACAVMGGMLRH